jgi:hypothetical protein
LKGGFSAPFPASLLDSGGFSLLCKAIGMPHGMPLS